MFEETFGEKPKNNVIVSKTKGAIIFHVSATDYQNLMGNPFTNATAFPRNSKTVKNKNLRGKVILINMEGEVKGGPQRKHSPRKYGKVRRHEEHHIQRFYKSNLRSFGTNFLKLREMYEKGKISQRSLEIKHREQLMHEIGATVNEGYLGIEKSY